MVCEKANAQLTKMGFQGVGHKLFKNVSRLVLKTSGCSTLERWRADVMITSFELGIT